MLKIKQGSVVTPASRHWRFYKDSQLWAKKYVKSKVISWVRKNGRNNSGSITVYGKSRGHKKLYRILDETRENREGVVVGKEYDPFRTSFVSRVYNYLSGEYFYILSPKDLLVGSVVASSTYSSPQKVGVRLGNALPLGDIPSGSLIHNLSWSGFSKKGSSGLRSKSQYTRSAGSFAQILEKKDGFARVRLSSGELRLFPFEAFATLGSVSNEKLSLSNLGKAGRSRWLGVRPKVRGVAMNPVDHPHGGGEGRTSGGRCSVTPWSKPTRGVKTSRSRNKLILTKRGKNG